MGTGPRRRRANAWAGVYLALFGSTEESADANPDAPERRGETGPENSAEHETG